MIVLGISVGHDRGAVIIKDGKVLIGITQERISRVKNDGAYGNGKIPLESILYCMSDFVDPYIIPESIKIIYGPQLWLIPVQPMVGKFDQKLTEKCVFNLLSPWVETYCREISSEYIMPISYFPLAVDTNKFKHHL